VVTEGQLRLTPGAKVQVVGGKKDGARKDGATPGSGAPDAGPGALSATAAKG